MWVWTSRETLRCPNLLVRLRDQLVCMFDVFMFIFVHSIVELVNDFHIDVCGLMVSLLMCADVGPHSPPRHRRRVVIVPLVADSTAAPFGKSRRQ